MMNAAIPQTGNTEVAIPQMQVLVTNLPFIRSGVRAIPTKHSATLPRYSLAGNADSSAYILVNLTNLLVAGARTGVIGPYSWLCAGYAMGLQSQLLEHYRIEAVQTSWIEKWFTAGNGAEVRAVILILQKKSITSAVNKPCRFAMLLIPLLNSKQCVANPRVLSSAMARQRYVSQSELSSVARGATAPGVWNRYLRAPNVYFDILSSCGDSLTALKNVATVNTGVKSGINAFFYVRLVPANHSPYRNNKVLIETQNKRRFYIESEFLKPLVRSPRELNTITAPNADAQPYRAFVCSVSRETLYRRRCAGALEYIEWGTAQVSKSGVPWPLVPSVRGRRSWWNLPAQPESDVLLPMSTGNRFAVFESPPGAVIDHNLFTCTLYDPAHKSAMLWYMNSTLFALFREVHARVGLGGGAAKLELLDWQYVPVPRELPALPIRNPAWFDLGVESIGVEMSRDARQELDEVVLGALGLDSSECLGQMRVALRRLITERTKCTGNLRAM